MANLVVHFELHATDPEVLITFYGELLGWQFTRFGEMEYWAIRTGDGAIESGAPGTGINGGLTRRGDTRPEVGAPINGCVPVIGVDGDIDQLFATGLSLGAVEALPLQDLPGFGRLGYLIDPDHNVFGQITPRLSDGTMAMGSGAQD